MDLKMWNIKDEALKQLSELPNSKGIQDFVLNEEIATYSSPVIKNFQFDGKEIFQHPVVLQILKITNVAVPKLKRSTATSSSGRLLKLKLTDGHSTINAVETDIISKLEVNTPPGTKILIKFPKVQSVHKTLLLDGKNSEIKGGRVEALVEKWLVAQSLTAHERSFISAENPPPPWVPFGQKISQAIETFKTLQNPSNKQADSEYEQKREAAVKEIQSETRSFAKNIRSVRDNLQDVVAAGFNESQANYALNKTAGNVAAAIKILKNQQERRENRARHRSDDKEQEYKPSTLNLGDFLKAKDEEQYDPPAPPRTNEYGRQPAYSRGGRRGRSQQAQHRPRGNPRGGNTGVTVQQLTNDFESWPGLGDESELWPGIQEAIEASKVTARQTQGFQLREERPKLPPSTEQSRRDDTGTSGKTDGYVPPFPQSYDGRRFNERGRGGRVRSGRSRMQYRGTY